MSRYDASSPPPGRPPWRGVPPLGPHPAVRWVALVLLLAAGWGFYKWFVERVEVPANHYLVLINKTGRTVPAEFSDQVILYPSLVERIAAQEGKDADWVRSHHKGIRYEVLTEGRYFFSPLWYKRVRQEATVIPSGKLGVKIRKYGKPLPDGKTVATEPDERGPVTEHLGPGRHNLNTLAYDVE